MELWYIRKGVKKLLGSSPKQAPPPAPPPAPQKITVGHFFCQTLAFFLQRCSTPPVKHMQRPPKRAFHEIQGPLLIYMWFFFKQSSDFNLILIEILNYTVQKLDARSRVHLV